MCYILTFISVPITLLNLAVINVVLSIPMFIMIYLVWFLIKKDFVMNKMLLEHVTTSGNVHIIKLALP